MINKFIKFGHWSLTSLIARQIVKSFGNFRDKEKFGLIERPNYAYGMLKAADTAKYFGKKEITCCEFGVAAGAGLENMANLADYIGKETGVKIHVFGFDTGAGLPSVETYKDHPEMWLPGDFPMGDPTMLKKRMEGRAPLIFGDIGNTIHTFVESLTEDAPIGFISVDVDIYTGTRDALNLFKAKNPNVLLPAISIYFDDVMLFLNNKWCGELAAIEEFNIEQDLRKIDIDRSLPGDRAIRDSMFYHQMYVAHILDHPMRRSFQQRPRMDIPTHLKYMNENKLQ